MRREQLSLFSPDSEGGLRVFDEIQKPPRLAPTYGLPTPLPPAQAHMERYVCPICSNDGTPRCYCEERGHISREDALRWMADFPGLPMGARLPVPPEYLSESCESCVFRGDAAEQGLEFNQIKAGGAVYCRQEMPCDARGQYRPLSQATVTGDIPGHPLCAGWLTHNRRQVPAGRAATLTMAAHHLALAVPGLSAGQVYVRTAADVMGWPERALVWVAYQQAQRAILGCNTAADAFLCRVPGFPAAWSPCKLYRYVLWRRWGKPHGPYMAVIGLNPSTADEKVDDRTLRRCMHFARREGCDHLAMVNLFAYRATKPNVMKRADDPIGVENDRWLREICTGASIVLVAWGNDGAHKNRSFDVERMLHELGIKAKCLGWNKNGSPTHPLYQTDEARLFDFVSKSK